MLTWTASGAVAAPLTLQIRVETGFAGRVGAGAPVPERALDDGEVAANLAHFTSERTGPRTRPVHTLVLSGVGPGRATTLAPLVARARAAGLQRAVLHAGPHDADELTRGPLGAQVDAVAVRFSGALSGRGMRLARPLHAVLVLDEPGLATLRERVADAVALGPERLTLSWPFPTSGAPAPPAAGDVVEALAPVLPQLAGLAWGLKGLPVCALQALRGQVDDLAAHVWRSTNRFYVDAAHQRDRALTFFPDIVRFAKRDGCRFCALDARCDGVAEEWLSRGLAGSLTPLS